MAAEKRAEGSPNTPVGPVAPPVEQQARQQTGQQQVMLRVDERNMGTCYSNAFRTNGTAEEVMLDFGVNLLIPPPDGKGQPAILFQVAQRVIMNYYSAKRLAIALSQAVRQYEGEFGELKMDAAERRAGGARR